MIRVSCQENLLPGGTDLDRWLFAADAGYSSVELRGQQDEALARRLPDLHRAAARGAVYRTVCVDMPFFVGAFAAEDRARAVRELRSQLRAIADLGGLGVVTPAAFGLFSRCLPPYDPPRTPEQERRDLVESLGEVAAYAASIGVRVLLEPLNRYEDHLVNTLDDARRVLAELPAGGAGLVADSFHLNIEERDVAASIAAHADAIAHVQISDSNRAIPGHGHLDWAGFLTALDGAGYRGELAVECLAAPAGHDRLIAEVPARLARVAEGI